MAKRPQKASLKQEQQRQAPNPPKAKASKVKRCWSKTMFIKGHGVVQAGDEASKEAIAAWKKHTKVLIDTFLT